MYVKKPVNESSQFSRDRECPVVGNTHRYPLNLLGGGGGGGQDP